MCGKKFGIRLVWAVLFCLTASFAQAADLQSPEVMARLVSMPMKFMALREPKDTGNLLFSDSPEYAERDGILYSDLVRGDSRMYFYHVNQTKDLKKFLVVATNKETTPVEIYVRGSWYSRPSTDYYAVGRELSELFYKESRKGRKITVPAGETVLLDEKLNDVTVLPDELFSGIVDFTVDGAAQVASVMMPADADPQAFMKKAFLIVSDDMKLRGRFKGKDRYLQVQTPYSTSDGISYIRLADGRTDLFLKGPDILDNRLSENVGNYGVDYTVKVPTTGHGAVHLYFNPVGGEYSGVVEVIRTHKDGSDFVTCVGLPRKGHSMGYNNAYAMEYVTTFKAGETVRLHFMPPGAANLPVQYIFVSDKVSKEVIKEVTAEEQKRKEANKLIHVKRTLP